MITLEKVRDSLRDWKFEVEVEPEIAAKAPAARSTAWSRSGRPALRYSRISAISPAFVGVKPHASK